MKFPRFLLSLVLLAAGVGRAQTLQEDLYLSGSANRLQSGATLTFKSGSTFVLEAGATFTVPDAVWSIAKTSGLQTALDGKQPLDADLTSIAAVATTSYGRSVLAIADAATLFGGIKQAATTSATGVVELATTAEVITGTDTVRAVTPAAAAVALHAYVDPIGHSRAPRQILEFNGTAANACSVALTTNLGTTPLDFACYVESSNTTNTCQLISTRRGINIGGGDGVTFVWGSGGQVGFYAGSSGASGDSSVGILPRDGRRRLLLLSFTPTGVNIYVEGINVANFAVNWASEVSTKLEIFSETIGGTAAPYFYGRAAVIGVWDFTLDATKRSRLFASGAPDSVDLGGGVTLLNETSWATWSTVGSATITGGVGTMVASGDYIVKNSLFPRHLGSRIRVRFTYSTSTAGNLSVGNYIYSPSPMANSTTIPLTGSGTYEGDYLVDGDFGIATCGWSFSSQGWAGTIDNLTITSTGLRVSPDPLQPGVGPVWRSMTGKSHILLAGDGVHGGVAWSLPSGSEGVIGPFDVTGGDDDFIVGGEDVRRVPAGYAIIGAEILAAAGSTGNVVLGTSTGGSQLVASTGTDTSGLQALTIANPRPISPERVWIGGSRVLTAGSLLWLRIAPTN